jgi:hypothetical protein
MAGMKKTVAEGRRESLRKLSSQTFASIWIFAGGSGEVKIGSRYLLSHARPRDTLQWNIKPPHNKISSLDTPNFCSHNSPRMPDSPPQIPVHSLSGTS